LDYTLDPSPTPRPSIHQPQEKRKKKKEKTIIDIQFKEHKIIYKLQRAGGAYCQFNFLTTRSANPYTEKHSCR
jgi:hypothetical protein